MIGAGANVGDIDTVEEADADVSAAAADVAASTVDVSDYERELITFIPKTSSFWTASYLRLPLDPRDHATYTQSCISYRFLQPFTVAPACKVSVLSKEN